MADTINDGGPAFPTENAMQTGPSSCRYEGMTMRDYFAAHAPEVPAFFLPADLEDARRNSEKQKILAARFFQWRWFYADMMLKTRDGQC